MEKQLRCTNEEKPEVIFCYVEVIIQMLRLQICTRVVPNDRRVDRGGSLECNYTIENALYRSKK